MDAFYTLEISSFFIWGTMANRSLLGTLGYLKLLYFSLHQKTMACTGLFSALCLLMETFYLT